MITNNKTKQAINAVLLHLFRKEEYCKNLQGNMFYNMEIMRVGYGDKASQLQSQYEKVLWIKNRIEALNHLLYGKIWDLYYAFFAAVDRYNNDKDYLDQLREQKQTIDTDIETARRNKNSYYSDYEAAQRRYTEIETDYNARIARKEIEIQTTQININNKRAALENAQAIDTCFSGDILDLIFDRIALAAKNYTVHSWTTERQCTFEDDSWNFVANQQGHPTWVEIPGLGSFISKTADFDWKIEEDDGWYYVSARIVTGSGLGGTIRIADGSVAWRFTTETDASTALQNLWTNTINTIIGYWSSQRPDVATLEAEVTALESQLATQQAELTQLQTDKTNALNAQQAVIDTAYSNYTYWRDEQSRLEHLKDDIDTIITTYEGVVEHDIDRIQSAADAYNDQLDSMDDEKVEEEGYPELPEPYNRDGHEPGPDVPVPDPRPEEEDEEDEDDQNDAGNDDDTE